MSRYSDSISFCFCCGDLSGFLPDISSEQFFGKVFGQCRSAISPDKEVCPVWYQIGFISKEPITDIARADALSKAIISSGLSASGTCFPE